MLRVSHRDKVSKHNATRNPRLSGTIPIQVCGKTFRGYIDTGADVSLMDKRVADDLGLSVAHGNDLFEGVGYTLTTGGSVTSVVTAWVRFCVCYSISRRIT